mgnify:CR=1 FL=1
MKKIKIGDKVRIEKLKKTALVKAIKGDFIIGAIGSIEVKVKVAEVQLQEISQNSSLKKFKILKPQKQEKSISIDYHGYTKDNCIHHLEELISNCYMKNISTIKIIHGKGSGILKRAIIDYLKKSSLNITFQENINNQGELIVRLG